MLTELLFWALWDVSLRIWLCPTPVVLALPVESSQHSNAGTNAQCLRMSHGYKRWMTSFMKLSLQCILQSRTEVILLGPVLQVEAIAWRELVVGTVSSLTSSKRQLQRLHQLRKSTFDSRPYIMSPSGHRAVITPV